jgi:hypothetical protein
MTTIRTNDQILSNLARSIAMYTMHEALARERLREHRQWAQRARVSRELAAVRRWQRLELRAAAAHRRHEQLAQRVTSAVAEARL